MPILPHKSRLLLSALILASFFVPAYNTISAFGFIKLAFSEVKMQVGITLIDVLIVITPLIFIPVIAIVVAIRSAMRVPIRTTILGLPLLLLIFFIVILSFTGKSSNIHLSASRLLFNMQIGFYLAAVASLLLIFTKNGHKHRHRRKRHSSKMATAVIN